MLTPVLSDSTVFAGFCCQTSLRHRLGMNSHYKLFELSKIDSFCIEIPAGLLKLRGTGAC